MTIISKDSLLFELPSSHSKHTYTDQDSGQYSTFVFAENKGLLIRSKDELSIAAFQELLAIDRKGLSNADFRIEAKKFFQFVIENQSSFEVLEDYREVYWEFCIVQGNHSLLPETKRGLPDKPIRSFDLLKRWFEIAREFKLKNEFELMVDDSEESRQHFILGFIESEIYAVNKFVEDGQTNLGRIEFQYKTPIEKFHYSECLVSLKSYKDWLSKELKNQTELKSQNEPLEQFDLDQTSKSWSIPKKLILLNELGLIDAIRARSVNGVSDNVLASVLKFLLSGNQGTIASGLSAINQGRSQDPYKVEKNVDAVRELLIEKGFKPPK